MKNNFINLYNKYLIIKKMGFVLSERKGPTGVGYTFEKLLNKSEESFPIPDFCDIEIKTMRNTSENQIHLFSIIPDGEYLFPMKQALEILGYPDKKKKEYKILNKDFNAKNWTNIGLYRRAKLVVDRKKEKIFLIGLDHLFNNLELNISWSFKMLEERLYLKLKNLAIITANCKNNFGKELFYYNDIKFYRLKDFNTFLSLIEEGIITIGFRISVFKDGIKKGKMKSRGTVFSIDKDNIEKLYEKVII